MDSGIAYTPEIVTLADIPRHHARVRPRAIATLHADRATTFESLHRRSSRVANGLIAAGIKPGARVAVLDQNSDRYFEIMLGVAKVGGVSVTVNWRLAPREVAYVLRDSCAEMLFVGGRHAAHLAALLADLKMLRQTILIDAMAGVWPAYEDWIGRYNDIDPGYQGAAQDTAVQIYTSGTTGQPKGVELAHATFYGLCRYRALEKFDRHFGWIDWQPGDTAIIAMPAFHIGGTYWAFLALYCGARSVILSQFDVGDVLLAIPQHRVTQLILVPTMIQQVLAHPDCATTDFSSLRYLLYGASPIPLELLREATAVFKCCFIQVYGMTELCGAVTYLPAADHNSGGTQRMRSAGKAITGVGLDIRDPEGRSLPRGTVGEICVHSATRMNGYWNLPDATAATMNTQGWVRTGDAGFVDSDGYLYVQDRIKDMIVSGGENVYPAEVESAIYGHPSVAEVAVIGVPDSKWGEAVKAIVVLKPGSEADADSILSFARSRIGGFKVPKSVEFVAALPKNATGKVLKRELRNPYWAHRDRQVN